LTDSPPITSTASAASTSAMHRMFRPSGPAHPRLWPRVQPPSCALPILTGPLPRSSAPCDPPLSPHPRFPLPRSAPPRPWLPTKGLSPSSVPSRCAPASQSRRLS
jgi:hypothetical protein